MDRETVIQLAREAGWLGKVFGAGSNAPTNIVGFVVLVLLSAGIASLFFDTAVPAADLWKLIAPMLTLVMGYMFGKSRARGGAAQ